MTMFSMRIVTTDHYQATPHPGIDVEYSEFRGSDVFKVPVIRIYGATPGGQKACMHVHGVFPYLYVPFDGTQPWDRYLRLFASSLDKAINVAQGHQSSKIQHVYKITLVSGIPMYGFHSKEEQFLKIYLYNPGLVRKVADLLLGGAVLNQVFQPHESHIPYTLQMFIDYNLYGMNLINLAAVKFRKKDGEGIETTRRQRQDSDPTSPKFPSLDSSVSSDHGNQIWDINTIPGDMYVDAVRQSTCELEVDAVAVDILNRLEVDTNIGGNPGLGALWEDEKQRRRDRGESSQITPQDSQEREDYEITESDAELQEKYKDLVLQLQPYMDSQSESDEGSQKEEDVDIPTTSASQVDLHLSQTDDGSDSSQNTVILEEEDKPAPVISLESIQRVVSFSQSFCDPDSQPLSQPLSDTQDRSLAQILASLAEDSSPPASQAAAQQVSVLEEQDSILHDKSMLPDEDIVKEDEEETLEMSQVVWHEDGEEDTDRDRGRRGGFDMAGIDDTWNDSQMDVEDKREDDDDDDDSEEETIPQLDGAADEKPDQHSVKEKQAPDTENKEGKTEIPDQCQSSSQNTQQSFGSKENNESQQSQEKQFSYQQPVHQQINPQIAQNWQNNPQPAQNRQNNLQSTGNIQPHPHSAPNQQTHHHMQPVSNPHQSAGGTMITPNQQFSPQSAAKQQSHQQPTQNIQHHPQMGHFQPHFRGQSNPYQQEQHRQTYQQHQQHYPPYQKERHYPQHQEHYPPPYQESKKYNNGDNRENYRGNNQDWLGQSYPTAGQQHMQRPYCHTDSWRSYDMGNQDRSTQNTAAQRENNVQSPTQKNQHSMLCSPVDNSQSRLNSPPATLHSPQGMVLNSPESSLQSSHSNVNSPDLTMQSPTHSSNISTPQGPMLSPSGPPVVSPPLPNFRGGSQDFSFSQNYPTGYQQNYSNVQNNSNMCPPQNNYHYYQQHQYYSQQQSFHHYPGYYQENHSNTPQRGQNSKTSTPTSKNNFKKKLKAKIMEKQGNINMPRNSPLSPSFQGKNDVTFSAGTQNKPQSTLERLLMSDDDNRNLHGNKNSNPSSQIGENQLPSHITPTKKTQSNPSSSSFSPFTDSMDGNSNNSFNNSFESGGSHPMHPSGVTSSQQSSIPSQVSSQHRNNESTDDLFHDLSQPSSSNSSMFNNLFDLGTLTPPSSSQPSTKHCSEIRERLNSPPYHARSQHAPKTPPGHFSQPSSSLESLQNLVSSVQRQPVYGVDVQNNEMEQNNYGNYHDGFNNSQIKSPPPPQQQVGGAGAPQSLSEYIRSQPPVVMNDHMNMSHPNQSDMSNHMHSSKLYDQHYQMNMSQPYKWESSASGNNQPYGYGRRFSADNIYDRNSLASYDSDMSCHTTLTPHGAKVLGQGQVKLDYPLGSQKPGNSRKISGLSKTKLSRSLSTSAMPKKRGRPRKYDSEGKITERYRADCESKPVACSYNSAYTYAFHVPSPVFKRLKFYKRDLMNDGIKVVRMHPKDARKYSLLKIGKEIVKVPKLTPKQIMGYTNNGNSLWKQSKPDVNVKVETVLDDKTGEMVAFEKSESEEKDSVGGTSNGSHLTSEECAKNTLVHECCDKNGPETSAENSLSEKSLCGSNGSVHNKSDSISITNFNCNVPKNGYTEADGPTESKHLPQCNQKNENGSTTVQRSHHTDSVFQKSDPLQNAIEGQSVIDTTKTCYSSEKSCDEDMDIQESKSMNGISMDITKISTENSKSEKKGIQNDQHSSLQVNDKGENCLNIHSKGKNNVCENNGKDFSNNIDSQLYKGFQSSKLCSIIDKVFHSSMEKDNNKLSSDKIGSQKDGKSLEKNSHLGHEYNNVSQLQNENKGKWKDSTKRCLSIKKRSHKKLNGNLTCPVIDPDGEELNTVILKDVNLTEASAGVLTPIRGHTPIANRSPIRMNVSIENYHLFDADIIKSDSDIIKSEELESKLKMLHPDIDLSKKCVVNKCEDSSDCYSSVPSQTSSRTTSRKDSSESTNSGCDNWKTKLLMRKRKLSSATSDGSTGRKSSLRHRHSTSLDQSWSDNVFEKENIGRGKKDSKRKRREVAGIDYIVTGRFKGDRIMQVNLERLDLDLNCSVNATDFIAMQMKKGDFLLQRPWRNYNDGNSLEKAKMRTPAFELFTKLKNEALGEIEQVQEQKTGNEDTENEGNVPETEEKPAESEMSDTDEKSEISDSDENSDDSLKEFPDDDNDWDSGSGENSHSARITPTKRINRKKMSRNQKLRVSFVSRKSRRKKLISGSMDKLLNSLSLLHDATIANLNDSNISSYNDSCSTDDFRVKYDDAMFKMSFLSSSDSEKGGSSPPQPLSPEELSRDQQGRTRSTSDIQSPVLSANENSLSPAHSFVPYKDCRRLSPISPFPINNHKFSSGIYQRCSSPPILSIQRDPPFYTNHRVRSSPPPLLNVSNHINPYIVKEENKHESFCKGNVDEVSHIKDECISKGKKAVVKLKPLSPQEIELYCNNGKLKTEEFLNHKDSGTDRFHDSRISDGTISPPDLGPPNIPKYPKPGCPSDISDFPPPLLVHRSPRSPRSPRSQNPEMLGYGLFEGNISKSPASCCSSVSLNVVHSDRFSDISDDEEDDREVRILNSKDGEKNSTPSSREHVLSLSPISDTDEVPILTCEGKQSATEDKPPGEKDSKAPPCDNFNNNNNVSRNTENLKKGCVVDLQTESRKDKEEDNVKSEDRSGKNILCPGIPPPSRQAVMDSAANYGLNTAVIQDAFCSNPDDLPEQPRELGGRVFKVQSTRVKDLMDFENKIPCEGLLTWRHLKIADTEIFPSQSENDLFKDKLNQQPQLRFALFGDKSITVTPCRTPPTRQEVERWYKGRKLLKKLQKDKKMQKSEKLSVHDDKEEKMEVDDNDFLKTVHEKKGNLKTDINENNSFHQNVMEMTDDQIYHNDTIIEDKENKSCDSFCVTKLTRPGSKNRTEDDESSDSNDDIISPSPPSGLRLSQFSKLKRASQTSVGCTTPTLQDLKSPCITKASELDVSTPTLSKHRSSLSQCVSTPIQKKKLSSLFSSAFTPIKSSEIREENSSKVNSCDNVKPTKFVTPRQVPLPRRQSTGESLQGSMTASQLGQYSTPANQKRHVSQIDAPTPQNSFGFKVSQQDFKSAKAVHEIQNLTVLSLELHAESRGDLRPDPEVDPILAVFYSISNDVSPDKGVRQVTGAIILDRDSADCQDALKERNKAENISASPQPSTSTGGRTDVSRMKTPSPQPSTSTRSRSPSPVPSTSKATGSRSRTPSPRPSTPSRKSKKGKGQSPRSPAPRTFRAGENIPNTTLQKSGVDSDLELTYVREESDILTAVVDLVSKWDPDILVGYEIQNFSWGYLLQRASHLSMPLISKLSRIPEEKKGSHFSATKDEYGADHASEIHMVGRIVLNLWRLLRHEVTLNIYSFENVTFHVLHQRIPQFSFRNLNFWFNHRTHLYRWRVIEYYLTRVKGNLLIMEQLDFIGRTSEFARVFGIEFYHVLSRGSQYRVESMMLRLAKPLNYIPVSPSVHQRARMRAPECIALTLEPESRFYADPVVVVDFQSLYPSIMIAHNYCFSTCLGRLKWLEKAHEGSIEFGCTHLKVTPSILKKLEKDITVSPNGVVFVKQHVRKGVISAMVEEILNTRLMVKKAMKEHKKDKGLYRLLDARQLGLKLIANVTYGYTAANFSGRMPSIEVADSIVRKARETLERAIKLVEDTPKWGARVVYGDTDSMFIELKGRSKEDAFRIGYEICDAVTASNPKPMKLKFEKVYFPCILQTKKRYVGFSYETPDQKEPIFDAKGIETVRRDSCTAVSKILEKCIKILFTTKDVSRVKQYVQHQCRKTMEGKVSMQDFIFAKEYRGMPGYKPGACVPALEIAKKLLRQDRRAEPRVGERVPYVIVYGSPGLPLIQLVRQPHELLSDPSLRLNATYYITKQILPPLDRIFSLMGINVFSWYNDMPKVIRFVPQSAMAPDSKKGTISQYFSASNCPICDEQTNQSVCKNCMKDPQTVTVTLNDRIRHWDRVYTDLLKVCSSCMGVQDENQPCVSLDCPILFRRSTGKIDISKGMQLRSVLHKIFDT